MRVLIAYFSGTGGTSMAAGCFTESFQRKGCQTQTEEITARNPPVCLSHDLLLLLFPVHAFNAPEGVYRWLDQIPLVEQIPAAVISVSGGGEISPNTACRVSTIRRLEKKGYRVFYENMLVMPSNVFAAMASPLPELLLHVLPTKADAMADRMVSLSPRRTKPPFFDRCLSRLGEMEKRFTGLFGRNIRVSDACTGCSWCARNCPTGNIALIDGKPHFASKCQLCMKCLYGCPQKALAPAFAKFFVLKEGISMAEWAKAEMDFDALDVDVLTKGSAWSGVRKYLKEKESSM